MRGQTAFIEHVKAIQYMQQAIPRRTTTERKQCAIWRNLRIISGFNRRRLRFLISRSFPSLASVQRMLTIVLYCSSERIMIYFSTFVKLKLGG
jgi:hypothetical protein